jgi:phosphoglycerate dehydrogenase-like enzyme
VTPRIAVAPDTAPDWVRDAVREGGGVLVEPGEADGLVWFDPRNPDTIVPVLAAAPHVQWIHLPWAGVEPYAHLLDHEHTWTCGKGVYAEAVAEHAMLLALAGLRELPKRIVARTWEDRGGVSLYDRPVTIVGGGGITEELLRHLAVYRCEVTVVRRRAEPLDGATRVFTVDHLHDALPGAQVVFLALALTPETEGIIGAAELALMDPSAWLVNVARGGHVVTDDLVDALRRGVIAGAALDVTDPEPLPDGHPLWDLDNCIITPHTANTLEMVRPAIATRVRSNVARFGAGDSLIGQVDVAAGY